VVCVANDGNSVVCVVMMEIVWFVLLNP
jgi:hypothetical protein